MDERKLNKLISDVINGIFDKVPEKPEGNIREIESLEDVDTITLNELEKAIQEAKGEYSGLCKVVGVANVNEEGAEIIAIQNMVVLRHKDGTVHFALASKKDTMLLAAIGERLGINIGEKI